MSDTTAPAPTARTPVAWGSTIVSILVLLAFGGVVAVLLLRGVPVGNETLFNVLLGTLSAMATSVVSYWVGSSAGSARKDELLHQSAPIAQDGGR